MVLSNSFDKDPSSSCISWEDYSTVCWP